MGLFEKISAAAYGKPPEFDPARACNTIRQQLTEIELDLVDVHQDVSKDRRAAAFNAGIARLNMGADKLDLLQEGLL